MESSRFAATVGALLLASSTAFSANLVFDSFESANLSTPNRPAPAINTNSFKWSGTNYTSVVGMLNGMPTRVFNGEVINEVIPGRDFNCFDGTYCLRFRYAAGNYMAEQRFDLGTAQPDIWLRYWVRVPTNFTHPSTQPNNQKFLALWMDGYEASGNGPTAWLSFFDNGAGGSTLGFTYSVGSYTGSVSYQQTEPFISVPADRGRWMQIVFHAKAATSRTSNDGWIETWRRWSNEASFTKLHEAKNLNIAPPPGGLAGWKAGYLMGWANAAYSTETEWLIDGFTVADESLITAGTTPASNSPPAAPVLRVLQ